MEYEIYNIDELYHHGTKGMRWGIRRYQNKDGSLTDRGKKRYAAELNKVREQEKVLKNRKATRAKIEKLEARKKAAADEKKELDATDGKVEKQKRFGRKQKSVENAKKSVNDMSDAELFEAINRARMEDTYRQLRPDPVEKPKVFKKLIDDVVAPAATSAGRKFLENALNKVGATLLEGKVDPNSLEALKIMKDKMQTRLETAKAEKELERLKSGAPKEKTTKELHDELRYKKDLEAYEQKKARDAAEAEKEARKAEKEHKDAVKNNAARTEYVTTAAGKSVDASNRRTAGWERKAKTINDEIDWDSPSGSKSDSESSPSSSKNESKSVLALPAPSSSKSTDLAVSTGSKYVETTGNSKKRAVELLESPRVDDGRRYIEDYRYSIEDADGNTIHRWN